ncbi:hypothetical protein [Bacillus sp. SG-1]|uniref:hypothetical protein n=1 Tax=Bacillus sp. SG-1 TaxID=161544 RepID=UPI00015434D6|nr:hypothetical protein [Bacillus sp. SG-1]EDL66509.1 hypothetical protein BSG1_04115 [Bacillus sp. SG-1]
MNRRIGVFLFIFLSFLTWLFFAIYLSDVGDWWTVMEVKQLSEEAKVVGISSVKVLISTSFFIVVGTVLNKVIKRL